MHGEEKKPWLGTLQRSAVSRFQERPLEHTWALTESAPIAAGPFTLAVSITSPCEVREPHKGWGRVCRASASPLQPSQSQQPAFENRRQRQLTLPKQEEWFYLFIYFFKMHQPLRRGVQRGQTPPPPHWWGIEEKDILSSRALTQSESLLRSTTTLPLPGQTKHSN